MAVCEVIQRIMDDRCLSVADIARICNLPDSTVRGIIRRKQDSIALDVAFKLSDGLGISLEHLNSLPEKAPPTVSDGGRINKDLSFSAIEVAKAYETALPKDKIAVRAILELAPLEEEAGAFNANEAEAV